MGGWDRRGYLGSLSIHLWRTEPGAAWAIIDHHSPKNKKKEKEKEKKKTQKTNKGGTWTLDPKSM